GDPDPALAFRVGNSKSDQGAAGMKSMAFDPAWKTERWRRRKPFFTFGWRALLRGGQPLASFATPVLQHARPAARAHPAQKSMDAPAIPLLGLVGPFDRASVPEPILGARDTACITSSRAQSALRYPQAGVIFPGRKQAGKLTKLRHSTNLGT